MALTGLHVICGFAGSSVHRDKSEAILGRVAWSEQPESGVATTNAAPGARDAEGQAIFRIRAAADSWVSVGTAPNPSTGTRFLVAAGTDYDVFADEGDRLKWIAA